MENIRVFVIKVNPSSEWFSAGQRLTGNVTVNLRKSMDIKNIEIELNGKGYCYWSEGEADHYIGKECIIKKTICLCGASTNSHSFTFPVGEQSYDFSFDLPERLPSSFEGGFGYVRYSLKARIRRHWKVDHKTKISVIINDVIDTNLPAYREGKGGENHNNVGLLCYKTSPVDMSASIDRGCYCPGDVILINSHVANNTSRDMQSMHAKLIQTVMYNASGKRRKSNKVIAILNGPNVPKGKSVSWENEPFNIPQIPSTITNCHVISVHYKLVIKVHVRCACDPAIKIDVVIGTIPFIQTNATHSSLSGPQRYADDDGISLIPSHLSTFIAPPRYSTIFGESISNTTSDSVLLIT